MLIERKEFNDNDGSLGCVESIFDSSNVIKGVYFPKTKKLFLVFSRGKVYSYANVSEETFKELENAESQGKYFNSVIKKNPEKYTYYREYSLYDYELGDILEIIKKFKNGSTDEQNGSKETN